MILVRNIIFQQKLALVSEIYWESGVQNFIQIRSELTFLFHDI